MLLETLCALSDEYCGNRPAEARVRRRECRAILAFRLSIDSQRITGYTEAIRGGYIGFAAEFIRTLVRRAGRYQAGGDDSRHFVRVYAIRNPLRSALRCESLAAPATIIARSQPWSNA